MDGFEAVKALKSDPKTRQLPVMALSAHSMDTDRDKAIASGFDDFETKPVQMDRLLKKIGNLIHSSST